MRAHIKSQGQHARTAIEVYINKQLSRAGNIDNARSKVLEEQKDDLNRHTRAMSNAIEFSKRLTGRGNSSDTLDKLCGAMLALDSRLMGLTCGDVVAHPRSHGYLELRALGEKKTG